MEMYRYFFLHIFDYFLGIVYILYLNYDTCTIFLFVLSETCLSKNAKATFSGTKYLKRLKNCLIATWLVALFIYLNIQRCFKKNQILLSKHGDYLGVLYTAFLLINLPKIYKPP